MNEAVRDDRRSIGPGGLSCRQTPRPVAVRCADLRARRRRRLRHFDPPAVTRLYFTDHIDALGRLQNMKQKGTRLVLSGRQLSKHIETVATGRFHY